jgi:predicted O-methyltransferase YrrM
MSELRVIYDELVKKYGEAVDTVNTFCDKGTDHTYIDFYATHFEQFKKNVSLFEIGIMTGGSLLVWSKYFEKYDITGIDYSPSWSSPRPFQTEVIEDPNIDLYFNANSTHKDFADGFDDQLFDIIIDDGDHDPNTQIATFRNYISKLKTGGIYFIEDIRGSFELEQVTREVNKWIAEKQISATVVPYIGNVQQRADDIILTIKL